MQRGELRTQIMEGCPDDFEDSLKDSIDKLESLLNDIMVKFSIHGIEGLSDIEDAYNLVTDLCNSLY